MAFQHAIGNLNVKTKCIVDNFDPNKGKVNKNISSFVFENKFFF